MPIQKLVFSFSSSSGRPRVCMNRFICATSRSLSKDAALVCHSAESTMASYHVRVSSQIDIEILIPSCVWTNQPGLSKEKNKPSIHVQKSNFDLALTLFCGLEIDGLLHSTVSPLHINVPDEAGVVDQVTLSFITVEFARGSTIA